MSISVINHTSHTKVVPETKSHLKSKTTKKFSLDRIYRNLGRSKILKEPAKKRRTKKKIESASARVIVNFSFPLLSRSFCLRKE